MADGADSKNIPFEEVIQRLYGVSVIPFDRAKAADAYDRIVAAMSDACHAVHQRPIECRRPNEVGNAMEPFVIRALVDGGLDAAAPLTKSGKGKSTGYPDIRISTDDTPIYLEVKTYAKKNRDTTQRSFYLSPADDPKVVDDAHHLLVGFEMIRNGNRFSPTAFEIVDLFGLSCDMKMEYNSDNRRLYGEGKVLIRRSMAADK